MYLASTSYLMVCHLSLCFFYSCTYEYLTLKMSFRRNLTLQRRSPIKLLLLFFSQALLSSGFCVSEIDFLRFNWFFYVCVYIYIFISINLENTFKAETFCSCLVLSESLPSSWSPHMHTLVVAIKGAMEPVVSAWSNPDLWLAIMSHHGAREFCIWVSTVVIRHLQLIWGAEVSMTTEMGKKTISFSCICKALSLFKDFVVVVVVYGMFFFVCLVGGFFCCGFFGFGGGDLD